MTTTNSTETDIKLNVTLDEARVLVGILLSEEMNARPESSTWIVILAAKIEGQILNHERRIQGIE